MTTVVLINAFEVPPAADERFVAAWERAVAATVRGATLHRALREDADFRFVEVARLDGADADGREMPFSSHSGLYEIAHEDGAPEGREGTTLINPFEVPEGEDERFLAAWDQARAVLAGRQGYLGTRLHGSTGPADFRFVNVARWSSPLMFARALQDPGFREVAATMPFASHSALYQVVSRRESQDRSAR